ncbi:conserved Plasmodium protein, unknown function [Plasmodium chabaudi adami]|uniref:J domain-containing protein n=1 Tax=Plasmodium chabaudi adami TaxID=5826 RepID=A0A1C6X6Z8_PLACE|nr:conserved Plasmodium protein, unknown function [Plasmodium chabaudi adami]
MFSSIKIHYRYITLRKCINKYNIIENHIFNIRCINFHNTTNHQKNVNEYFDYNEDYKLLKRLQNSDLLDVLDIKDDKDGLKIKKKYLKLLRAYHPDTYMKEKNEKRKKMKEEIFIQIYTKYKNFSNQYDMHKPSDFDESIYENEEDKEERLERYKRYSEGKRNDINTKNIELYILITILLIFVTVFLICAYLPFNANPTREELCEAAETYEKVQIVSCFYNPVMKRYEYLSSEYFIPPTPQQLYYFYKNNFPNLDIEEDILNMRRFEIVKLPKNRAKKCRLVYDLKTNELIFLKKKIKEGNIKT